MVIYIWLSCVIKYDPRAYLYFSTVEFPFLFMYLTLHVNYKLSFPLKEFVSVIGDALLSPKLNKK